jgi:membrane protease YdiL (CAAX protease family)
VFLATTLCITWGIAQVTAQYKGENAFLNPDIPPLGMLVPAFVAICIEVFWAKDSKIYFRKYHEKPRLIFLAYLLITLLLGVITIVALTTQIIPEGLRFASNILFVLWPLLVIRLYKTHGEDSFKRAGLQLGDTQQGVKFIIGVVIFLLVQSALNGVLNLGQFKGVQDHIYGIQIPEIYFPVVLVGYLMLTIVGSPLGGLMLTFGEEYGWRGFLQRELSPLGCRLGAFIVGLVWAVWHIPIISSGVHTYPPTLIGFTFSFVFFILWGFVQSYSVLKTGSIWVAVFLHGVVNSVYAFTITYVLRPEDMLFSFGLGAYGLVILSIIVFLILRDPIWGSTAVDGEESDLIYAG